MKHDPDAQVEMREMKNEIFELKANDARLYFQYDDDIMLQKGDRVIIELLHDREAATWMIVPQDENPSNCVPTDDDYDGAIAWLNEHDYHSPAITARRKSQIGIGEESE